MRSPPLSILDLGITLRSILEKGSILDIRATDESGCSFLIEMQATPKP
jgi:hypothetical protein